MKTKSHPNAQATAATIKNKKRAPRFQRLATPPVMILQERDREIVRAVWGYQALTREQIQRLIFPTTRSEVVTRRLKKLYHNCYLDRVPLLIRSTMWPMKPVYRIAQNGAAILAFEQHIPVDDLSYWGNGDDTSRHQ